MLYKWEQRAMVEATESCIFVPQLASVLNIDGTARLVALQPVLWHLCLPEGLPASERGGLPY